MASNTLAGVSYQFGTNPLTLSATRFILPAIVLILILKTRGLGLVLPKRIAVIPFILGLITVIYTMALLHAIEVLPLAIAILIFYLFPIFTGLMLAVFRWQKLSLSMVMSGLIAFLGITLALGAEFIDLDGWGIIYAVTAAIGLATVSVMSNRLMADENPLLIILYLSISSTLILVIVCLLKGGFVLPKTGGGWIIILISQVFFAYAMIAFFTAISIIGAGETTFFNNIEPIMAIGAGFLFLNQNLTILQYTGILIVILALLYYGKKST